MPMLFKGQIIALFKHMLIQKTLCDVLEKLPLYNL